MNIVEALKDRVFRTSDRRKVKARKFAQELNRQFMLSPLCSDYENLFAQIRPFVDEMKMVMPYGIGRNGGPLSMARTPEIALLKDPNDDMGWAEFADLMFTTWLTEDELDIHVWFSKSGRVEGYTVIPPQCRIYLGDGRWQWQVMTTEGLEVLTEEDVMRLRFSRSPRDPQRGVSPASAVRIWSQVDDLVSQYQRAFFENGAIPATITFISASTKEQYEATRHELEHKLKGADNHNKTVFAWRQFDDEGNSADQIEVKTIQGANSTLAIKDIVSIVNDRLNKSVGVSNFILGDDSSAKYDNAELSDHQFTKRRIYPALVSFWNQFQHELDRLTGGLGYGITFDLEIPELTERTRAKAEIAKIRGEALVNLISAGASASGAVLALGLPESWQSAADGIYSKGLLNELRAPITLDNEKKKSLSEPKTEATVDELPKCTCSHDALPEMNEDERKIYDILVNMARSVAESDQEVDLDGTIEEITQVLQDLANQGEIDGAEAMKLLADKDVAGEIAGIISRGEVYASRALSDRIAYRAQQLVEGYAGYTRQVVDAVLNADEPMSANERREKLEEVLPTQRAELIARNETVYAIKSGRLEQDVALASKYGLNVVITWNTSDDAKVCPVCAAMAGKTTTLGDAFQDTVEGEVDGEIVPLSWTQDSWNDEGRIPSAHPNCRCYFTEELK